MSYLWSAVKIIKFTVFYTYTYVCILLFVLVITSTKNSVFITIIYPDMHRIGPNRLTPRLRTIHKYNYFFQNRPIPIPSWNRYIQPNNENLKTSLILRTNHIYSLTHSIQISSIFVLFYILLFNLKTLCLVFTIVFVCFRFFSKQK